jgi:hypothetical protein
MEYMGGRRARLGVDERAEGTASRAKAPRAPRKHARAQGRANVSLTSHAHVRAERAGPRAGRAQGHAGADTARAGHAEAGGTGHAEAGGPLEPRPGWGCAGRHGGRAAGRGPNAVAGDVAPGGRARRRRACARHRATTPAAGMGARERAGAGGREVLGPPRPGRATAGAGDRAGTPWPRAMAGEARPRHAGARATRARG